MYACYAHSGALQLGCWCVGGCSASGSASIVCGRMPGCDMPECDWAAASARSFSLHSR
jgi:hypothetical protein